MVAPDCCTILRICWRWRRHCRSSASGPARRTPPWSSGSPTWESRSSRRQCLGYIAMPSGIGALGSRPRRAVPGHACWPTPNAQLFGIAPPGGSFIRKRAGPDWIPWYMSMTGWWNVCVLPSGWKFGRLSCGRTWQFTHHFCAPLIGN